MTNPQLHFDDQLQPLDLLMYRGESNPQTRSSFLALTLLDKTPDFAQLRNNFERASRVFLRLRQRVVVPAVAVTPARWVVDPDFDLDFHLRRMQVPAPGNLDQVLDFANQFLSDPLDLNRPLWEAIVLEGVEAEGASAALLIKLQHALTDGIGGLSLLQELFSLEPDAPPRSMPPLPIPEEISPEELVRKALLKRAGTWLPDLRHQVRRGLRLGSEWLRQPRHSLQQLRDQVESAQRVMGPLPAPPSPLLHRRSLGRKLAALELPLDSLRKAAKAQKCTLNDAYLSAVAAGLRRYHEQRGMPLEELAISIPVNTRKPGEHTTSNQFAGARLVLPVGDMDPASRMRSIHQRVRQAIAEPGLNLADYLAPLLTALPDNALHRVTDSLTLPDIQASNVPGPPTPLYLNGCRVVRMFPFGPVPGVAAMITMLSIDGTCCLGLHLDTASVTDAELFRRCLEEGFTEVIGAEPDQSRRGRPRAKAKRKAPARKAASGSRSKRRGSAAPKSAASESAHAETANQATAVNSAAKPAEDKP